MQTVNDWKAFPNFKSGEMACRCSDPRCPGKTAPVSEEFMQRLQRARTRAGVPFSITSCCRCVAHNRAIGSNDSSDHVCGNGRVTCGADIAAADSSRRFRILQALFAEGFDRIAVSFERNFIHVGIGKNLGGVNDSDVSWRY